MIYNEEAFESVPTDRNFTAYRTTRAIGDLTDYRTGSSGLFVRIAEIM
jgi:hypothetical protein